MGSAATVSVLAHAGVAVMLILAQPSVPRLSETPPILVTLVDPPPKAVALPASAPGEDAPVAEQPDAGSDAPPAPTPPEPVRAPEPRPARLARPSPTPSPVVTRPTPIPIDAVEPMPTLGAAQLAGALTAGSGAGSGAGLGEGAGAGRGGGSGGDGAGGGECDMVRRLQNALRSDPEIQAAAARAHRTARADGRALLIWNGDWIREPGQEGKGLAGVRQAIAVEVGFSPQACRAETVQGFVLITLADDPRAPRLALGGGRWRWSDLL